MSEEITTNENQEVSVDSLEIGELRKAAKALNIQAERTWSKDDYIRAIQKRQKEGSGVMNFLPNGKEAPPPGYARIIVHRNPTPGHKNTPIHVGLNGTILQVPRGIEVDMPKEFINALKDAISKEMRETENGKFEEVDQLSYPFQVVAITPGQWTNRNDNRAAAYKIRKEFFNTHGVWPTSGELREFKASRNKR